MGNACTPYRDRTALVKLNVYDYTGRRSVTTVNDWLHNFGSGAYHLGVVVHGTEWSFRKTDDGGSGVFRREPGECTEHLYREEERLGRTELSQYQVESLLKELAEEWPGSSYNLLHRNSGHFCDELCRRLGVGSVPEWATRLASKGARVDDKVQQVAEHVRAAANVVATKVSEVDERLQLRSAAATVAAKASELDEHLGLRGAANSQIQGLKAKADELNTTFGIADAAATAAARAQGLAAQAADKAQSLAGHATDKAQGLAAQASESTHKTICIGKAVRGAAESDNYQFGDLTRGLIRGAWAEKAGNAVVEGPAK